MARKTSRKQTFKKRSQALNNGLLIQVAKELSSIPAYAMRELTGQPQGHKPKCTLKKGWFE